MNKERDDNFENGAETAVDTELLEEVRREVQELLHGVNISQEDREPSEYSDFNRKYEIGGETA